MDEGETAHGGVEGDVVESRVAEGGVDGGRQLLDALGDVGRADGQAVVGEGLEVAAGVGAAGQAGIGGQGMAAVAFDDFLEGVVAGGELGCVGAEEGEEGALLVADEEFADLLVGAVERGADPVGGRCGDGAGAVWCLVGGGDPVEAGFGEVEAVAAGADVGALVQGGGGVVEDGGGGVGAVAVAGTGERAVDAGVPVGVLDPEDGVAVAGVQEGGDGDLVAGAAAGEAEFGDDGFAVLEGGAAGQFQPESGLVGRGRYEESCG
ncbi:hypothetical protein [Streptomyces sp. NPDC001889]